MPTYHQTAYNQRLGLGSDTIHSAGCFLTSFCNLMSLRFGVNIDPPTLNIKLISAKQFAGSLIKGWSSITSVFSYVVVAKTGTGWPNPGNAIVEFRYVENGENMTHFSLMHLTLPQTIIDSWDGVTRKSGYYGVPAAYATYKKVGIVGKVVAAVKPKPAVAPVVPVTSKPKPPAQQFYAVKSGDTLSAIATKYKLSLANIEHLNPAIKNPNRISVGQKVRVK